MKKTKYILPIFGIATICCSLPALLLTTSCNKGENGDAVNFTISGDHNIDLDSETLYKLQIVPAVAGKTVKVNWISSDNSIATINEEGQITPHKGGSVTITAICRASADIKATFEIAVGSFSKITFDQDNPNCVKSAGDVSGVVTIPNRHYDTTTNTWKNIDTILERGFYENTEITSISLPTTLKHIKSKAFELCTGLTKINLPESLIELGSQAFDNCTKIVDITIPGNVETIGENCFYKCENLLEVNLSEGLKHIGDFAFLMCQKLRQVLLPRSVVTIGKGAYQACEAIKKIEFYENVNTIKEQAFWKTGLTWAEFEVKNGWKAKIGENEPHAFTAEELTTPSSVAGFLKNKSEESPTGYADAVWTLN